MAKKRNYKAEYRRRVKKAKKRGISRAQARGHPKHGEYGLKEARGLGIKPVAIDLVRKARKWAIVAKKKHRKPKMPKALPETINVVSQSAFIDLLKQQGFSEREAYTMWFSP